VQKFDTQGNFLASYGSEGPGNGEFFGASMGALDSQGNMYIADLFNARVQKLDANGQFLMAWGTPGSEDGQFFMPVTIVLDDAGRLYVADNTNRIQVFTTDGHYLGKWNGPGKGKPPWDPGISGLAIDRKGDIYVAADSPRHAIYVFRPRP
jgi:DNA-binding beta-propeller fold protein YncE